MIHATFLRVSQRMTFDGSEIDIDGLPGMLLRLVHVYQSRSAAVLETGRTPRKILRCQFYFTRLERLERRGNVNGEMSSLCCRLSLRDSKVTSKCPMNGGH